MDAIVEAALRKWPNVPACRGWLGLDARGDWYLRDDRAQAAGPFPGVKGSVLRHETLRDYIHRNYLADADGAWFFQNGPQRVYVELEVAPFIWEVQCLAREASSLAPGEGAAGHWRVSAHTGAEGGTVEAAFVDEHGRLFLAAAAGFGLVRSSDMHAAAEAVACGRWVPQPVRFEELPGRFGYRLSPERDARAATSTR